MDIQSIVKVIPSVWFGQPHGNSLPRVKENPPRFAKQIPCRYQSNHYTSTNQYSTMEDQVRTSPTTTTATVLLPSTSVLYVVHVSHRSTIPIFNHCKFTYLKAILPFYTFRLLMVLWSNFDGKLQMDVSSGSKNRFKCHKSFQEVGLNQLILKILIPSHF